MPLATGSLHVSILPQYKDRAVSSQWRMGVAFVYNEFMGELKTCCRVFREGTCQGRKSLFAGEGKLNDNTLREPVFPVCVVLI